MPAFAKYLQHLNRIVPAYIHLASIRGMCLCSFTNSLDSLPGATECPPAIPTNHCSHFPYNALLPTPIQGGRGYRMVLFNKLSLLSWETNKVGRMSVWKLLGLSLAGILVVLAPARSPSAGELIPGTEIPLGVIVAGAAWEFDIGRCEGAAASDGDEEATQCLVSSRPYKFTASGDLFLRARLVTRRFATPAEAATHYRDIVSAAHPDMGLTYAWDLVVARGEYLYRLHAACAFSGDTYRAMADRFKLAVREGGRVPFILRCRCGGGCKED